MKKLNAEYIRSVSRKFNYSEINSKAAELSFYLLLSMFPFLIFTISIIVYIQTFHFNKKCYSRQCILYNIVYNKFSN